MKITDAELIGRFALHVQPKGFVWIRHYGILSSYHKRISLAVLQTTLGAVELKEKESLQYQVCPECKKGKLITKVTSTAGGPPAQWLEKLNTQKNK